MRNLQNCTTRIKGAVKLWQNVWYHMWAVRVGHSDVMNSREVNLLLGAWRIGSALYSQSGHIVCTAKNSLSPSRLPGSFLDAISGGSGTRTRTSTCITRRFSRGCASAEVTRDAIATQRWHYPRSVLCVQRSEMSRRANSSQTLVAHSTSVIKFCSHFLSSLKH